jgi:hypothetical protein
MYEHKRGRESRERVEQGDGVVVVVVGRDVIGRVGMRGGGVAWCQRGSNEHMLEMARNREG